jgi:hypothetical protein
MGSWSLGVFAVMPAQPTGAAPFEGAGAAAHGERGGEALARASKEARKAALAAAIEAASTDVNVRAEQLRQVNEDWANWTGAYRVAAVDRTPTQVLARIEVDVDIPRLKKVLASSPLPGAEATFVWGGVSMSGCSAVTTPTQVYATLLDAGLVEMVEDSQTASLDGAGGRSLKVSLSCSDTGDVAFTYLRGGKARFVATVNEVKVAQAVGVGLGASATEAAAMAVREGIEELKMALARQAAAGVRLTLKGVWRSANVEGITRRIQDAVRGVESVRVFEVNAVGEVVLGVETSGSVRQTYDAMVGLDYVQSRGLELRMNPDGGIDVQARETESE